jgi:hypothetical protein
MKTLTSLLILGLFTGCTPKDVTEKSDLMDTGSATEADAAVVWEDLRHQTSQTFLSAYADGIGLYVVTSGGQSWSYRDGLWSNIPLDVDEEDLNGLWGNGTGAGLKMVGVGNAGTIIEWDGPGALWGVTQDGTANFAAVDGQTVNDLIAVGGAGAWSNASGTWTPQTTAGYKFNDVWYDGTTAVAVGDDGLIGTYTKDEEWVFDDSFTNVHLYGVSGTNDADIWAVGQDGTVLHWNGSTWQEIDLDTQANIWSVWATTGNVAYVVGNNGEAYKIQGSLVEAIPTGVNNILYDITGTTEANLWAIGSRGIALRFMGE